MDKPLSGPQIAQQMSAANVPNPVGWSGWNIDTKRGWWEANNPNKAPNDGESMTTGDPRTVAMGVDTTVDAFAAKIGAGVEFDHVLVVRESAVAEIPVGPGDIVSLHTSGFTQYSSEQVESETLCDCDVLSAVVMSNRNGVLDGCEQTHWMCLTANAARASIDAAIDAQGARVTGGICTHLVLRLKTRDGSE